MGPSEAARPSASLPKESEPSAARGAAAAPGSAHKTNTLWVDNLPAHAGEDGVIAASDPHEALDCVIACIGSHSYMFVLLCFVTESRDALEALRGSKVKSVFIWVEYTRLVTSHPLLLPPLVSAPTLDPQDLVVVRDVNFLVIRTSVPVICILFRLRGPRPPAAPIYIIIRAAAHGISDDGVV